MDLIIKKRNWTEFKIKLKLKYPQLTEIDLQHKEGKEESMLRMIEYKLQKTKKEMREIISEIGYITTEK